MIIMPIETTTNQVIGLRPPTTTVAILSVIDPKVCPGSMSGAGS
jgi:hypothetical protein